MATGAKLQSALPSHMKPAVLSNGEGIAAAKLKHHGKSQSHVVSSDENFILFDVESVSTGPEPYCYSSLSYVSTINWWEWYGTSTFILF